MVLWPYDTFEMVSSLRPAIAVFQRRFYSGLMLVLFLLMQAMPMAAMWSGPSLKGMECCRRKANGHSCCKRQSHEPVMKSTDTCGGSSCCVVPSVSFSVRYSVVLPPVTPIELAVVAPVSPAPEPRVRPAPGHSPVRFQRPPPVA